MLTVPHISLNRILMILNPSGVYLMVNYEVYCFVTIFKLYWRNTSACVYRLYSICVAEPHIWLWCVVKLGVCIEDAVNNN